MGKKSLIEWTDASWNPWHGCKKVSPGCKYCYMYRDKKRFGQDPTKVVRSKTTFNDPRKWAEPKRIFTCSWSDWFIEEADPWRSEAWDIIRWTPQHTYQILTKRPERINQCLPAGWGAGWPNVWLGVSVENQDMAELRIPLLLDTPAWINFLSAEPLLGPIDFMLVAEVCEDCDGAGYYEVPGYVPRRGVHQYHNPPSYRETCDACGGTSDNPGRGEIPLLSYINFLIVGGESGPGFRPMDPQWAIDIKDQCGEYGVAFFMKQMGGWPNTRHRLEDMPLDLRLREFPVGC